MSDISEKIISIETDKTTASSASLALESESYTGVLIIVWTCAFLWALAIGIAAWLWAAPAGLLAAPTPILFAIAALAIIPAVLFLLLGMMVKRVLSSLSANRALIAAADTLTRPDAAAQHKVTTLAQGIRSQIIGVDSELKAALDRLAGMENVLRGHTDALANSHIASSRQTGEIANRLSEEREGLKQISSNFDERMGALSRLLTEHSDRLAQATQVAEQKIQEARVSVEGAAAKINASSEIVRDNALAATDSLTAGEVKITSLGSSIQAQARALDDINARHAADMAALVSRLEEEQSRMRETMDARLESMRDMSLSAKLSAESLNEAGDAGRRTIEALAKSAELADNAVRERFKEMEDMVDFSASKAESITDRAAQRVRDSLSLTRLEISRIEDDMRGLEQRLTDRAGDFERRETAVDVTPKPAWRKSLLRFRPAEPEEPEALVLTPPRDTQPAASRHAGIDLNEIEIPRPAPNGSPLKPAIQSAPDTGAQPLNITPVAPALSLAEPQSPVQEMSPAAIVAEPKATLEATLEMETPPADPILPIDLPQTPGLSASRIDPPQLRSRKEKSGWSLRSLFGRNAEDEAPQPVHDDFSGWDDQCAAMIADLSGLGLSPGAVVEAGTIIEAVNMRVTKGPDAMRKTVAMRMGEPVRHLQGVFSEDPAMRASAEKFASRYYQVISAAAGDREAIRTQLETDAGRAFLLCDAALG